MYKLIFIWTLLYVNSLIAQDNGTFSLFKLQVHERKDTLALGNMEFHIKDLITDYSFSVFADSNGLAIVKVALNHPYSIYATDPNNEYYDSRIDSVMADSLVKEIRLETTYMQFDYILSFPVIYFEKNSSELSDIEIHKIDSFVAAISKYSRLIFEVCGHANEFKASEKNYYLSLERANKVKRQIDNSNFAHRNYYSTRALAEFGDDCPCYTFPKEYPKCSYVNFRLIGRFRKY